MFMSAKSRLLGIALFIVAGILIVIGRKILFLLSKSSQNSLIDEVKINPKAAVQYAEGLDMTYGKLENISAAGFEFIKTTIDKNPAIGSYKILYWTKVNPNSLLIFTVLSFSDFDVNLVGQGDDIRKKVYHNFVLQFVQESSAVIIYSDLYNDTTSKFQKQEFLKALLELKTT